MNLFSKINLLTWHTGQQVKRGIGRIFNLSLTDPKSWNSSLWALRGSQSVSGETVTEATALTYSAVWNAVSLISGTTASLPLHLMQKTNKSKHIVGDTSLHRIMHDQWNPYMTAMQGREVMMSHILTWGNGYAEKVRNGFGEIVALWPIPPNRISKMEMKDGEIIYDIQVQGAPSVKLTREQVLHIPGLSFDGFLGYSPIAMARKSIGLSMALETFGSLYFGQGTHPGIIITHPNKLGTEGHANLKKALTDTYSGLGQSHRLMLLEEGMKPEKIGIPPEDSQFLESRQFQIPEICRWYNLPPHKLKDLTKSSFNNIQNEQISFVTDSILPWLIRLEQNYHMQLLTPREQKEKLYFNHVVEGLLRGNSKDRAIYYKTAISFGWMTENEVRQLENLDPNSNPLADELWMMANMRPLSQFGQESIQDETEVIESAPILSLPKPKEALKQIIFDRKKDNVDWKKIYEEGNAHWADDMQPSKFAQEFAQELIDKGKKSILEIGCGNGRDSILFALAGLDVTAIDLVPEAIEIAKENAENVDVKIDFQVGNAEKLGFSDSSFDTLFTLSVLHATNMGKSISEAFRVLKKKGLAFIYIYSKVEKIDGTEEIFISIDEYIDLLKKNNFKLLDLYTHLEDEFDEAGEKHLIIVSEVEKLKLQGKNALIDISVKRKPVSNRHQIAATFTK